MKMVRGILIATAVLQLGIALLSEGLYRSLAELTAFLIVVAIVFDYRRQATTTLPHSHHSA
ncbi:hypothetical protein RFA42_000847 [Vibrio vulnificus]|uniref:hypothetical protein n=2 Tax=Vibrio vulnificus TaxID=672 RepID=UPI001029A71D|nr:hypothetical protein [Vibrio vulnificus]EKZ9200111.1 hypothetical protein [Vibrio vulnificus]ELL0584185.1 hypothetical protein [Vibrio vulnificus]MCU8517150.1 hypothetical protein [Vibrio vulnificus]HDY8064806.1 hypothetical protein [Vibrio vulnificus]